MTSYFANHREHLSSIPQKTILVPVYQCVLCSIVYAGLCVYVFVCVCVHRIRVYDVCITICVKGCTHMSIFVYLFLRLQGFRFSCASICVSCVLVCTYACSCLCVYLFMYLYVPVFTCPCLLVFSCLSCIIMCVFRCWF